MGLFRKKNGDTPKLAREVWHTCRPCNGVGRRTVHGVPDRHCPDCNGVGRVLAS
ncbi:MULTISPECIES: hypothetical protein [unclassified Microbispora]|uniref:hypothetical protein n=1 Tax=unclassified Microbispora TaxID=2614687 RepID=UPI0016031598|nr:MULTISPECIES: hypothetical protein [unclassified Microbispora]WSS07849.1 hypothetical protein OG320_04285 [Microbispora sp. NBC_01189]